MKCPSCSSVGAYVGFSSVECDNSNCMHYKSMDLMDFVTSIAKRFLGVDRFWHKEILLNHADVCECFFYYKGTLAHRVPTILCLMNVEDFSKYYTDNLEKVNNVLTDTAMNANLTGYADIPKGKAFFIINEG